MCYKKPGPRCSPQAKSILAVAKRDLASVIGDDKKAFAAYEKVKTAQYEYDLTPAGQAEIQAQILVEADVVKKYELQQRLAKAVQQRKAALHQAKAKDVGDVPHEAPVKKSKPERELHPEAQKKRLAAQTPILPTDPIPNSGHQFDDYTLRNHVLHPNELPFSHYTEYDEETNMSTVTIQGWDRKVTADDWFKEVYSLKGSAPASFYEEFDGFDFEDHLEPQIGRGYYGDEFDGLQVSEELKKKTEKVFYALPDADDYYKGYEYARQEGIDTTGLSPTEAVKEAVKATNPRLSNSTVVDGTRQMKTEVVNLLAIKLDHIDLADSTPYNYKPLRKEPNPSASAGVLIQNSRGEYLLVGGAERFKAASDTGRNTWKFHVLY